MNDRLPEFPWDRLAAADAAARAHPGGLVDLSVGTPIDPVPAAVRAALAGAAEAPGYPQTAGTADLRAACVRWLTDRHGVTGLRPAAVLPTVGSKEFIALLPGQLGLGAGDAVVHPALAYPTYDIGARLAGAEPVAADDLGALAEGVADRTRLVWLNSPSNPTGAVRSIASLRAAVRWARAHDAVLASDECYLDMGWDTRPCSLLHPEVCDGDHTGLLVVHSLSKRSNLAGYRAGFVAGDPDLVADLLLTRRHTGLMVPSPVQAAMVAAYSDESHVAEQRARYTDRRALLLAALNGVGFTVEDSVAGLYLWVTREEPCWDSVSWLADRGILVAPGEFYGAAGARHVRVALTATDERVATAAERLVGA